MGLMALLLLARTMNAQYADYRMKEHFDETYLRLLQPQIYDNSHQYYALALSNTSECAALGSGYAASMNGLLDLYLATGDKAYLYEFMHVSKKIMNNRQDYKASSASGNPWWFDYLVGHYANFNARVTWPLARFAYIVKSEGLTSEPIVLNPYNGQTAAEFSGAVTFGGYAGWIADRVDETLQFALGANGIWYTKWCYNYNPALPMTGMMIHLPADPNHSDALSPINSQTPWGVTYMYMYLYNTSTYYNYGVKAVQIARLLSGKNCDANITSASGPDVFNDNGLGAYEWYYDPWRGNFYGQDHEDLGHALWDVAFPILYNQHSAQMASVTASVLFPDAEIDKFAKTFTDFIYDNVGGVKGYHNCVFGHDGSASPSPSSSPSCNLQGGINSYVFNYAPSQMIGANYAEYIGHDAGAIPNIYNILMTNYNDYFKGNYVRGRWHLSSMKARGFGKIINEQWSRECVKLELTKRHLYYDQNFWAVKDLTVDPKNNDLNDSDPINDYDIHESAIGYWGYGTEAFVIDDGVNSNFRSGTKVVLKDGFHAQEGSSVRVYIDPELDCEMYHWDESSDDPPVEKRRVAEMRSFAGFGITPNPGDGEYILSLHQSSPATVQVHSIVGTLVHEGTCNSERYDLDLSAQHSGVYLVTIVQEGYASTQRLIKQ